MVRTELTGRLPLEQDHNVGGSRSWSGPSSEASESAISRCGLYSIPSSESSESGISIMSLILFIHFADESRTDKRVHFAANLKAVEPDFEDESWPNLRDLPDGDDKS